MKDSSMTDAAELGYAMAVKQAVKQAAEQSWADLPPTPVSGIGQRLLGKRLDKGVASAGREAWQRAGEMQRDNLGKAWAATSGGAASQLAKHRKSIFQANTQHADAGGLKPSVRGLPSKASPAQPTTSSPRAKQFKSYGGDRGTLKLIEGYDKLRTKHTPAQALEKVTPSGKQKLTDLIDKGVITAQKGQPGAGQV